MAELIETRWNRYGKDRVYVKTIDGIDLGHVDLVARSVVSTVPAFEVELKECLRRWTQITDDDAPVVAVVEPPTTQPGAVAAPTDRNVEAPVFDLAANNEAPVFDLAANIAGAAARAKRNEVNAQAPGKNFVARLLGVKPDERA